MNLTRDRLHTIGWGMALSLCVALTLALTFRVNAVKSRVQLADRQIIALQQEKMFLETEFETRSSQQALKNFNDVDFGYEAPTAGQYLESERQLAALGKVASPDAPAPIRMASVESAAEPAAVTSQPGLAARLIGGAVAVAEPATRAGKPMKADQLGARLAQVGRHKSPTHEPVRE